MLVVLKVNELFYCYVTKTIKASELMIATKFTVTYRYVSYFWVCGLGMFL